MMFDIQRNSNGLPLNNLQKEQHDLMTIKHEMIELKLKVFNSNMNPHFVFNALNAIQYFITSEDKKSALEYLSVFSKLIRFNLNYLEKETVLVRDEINMLTWYLKLQKLRYNNQFEYKIAVDNDKNYSQAKIPSFILQTVIENIIENAIFNQHKNQTISLNFSINPTDVKVSINYRHSPQLIDKIKYTPEYRKRIMQWQDQIRLLNKINNYSIEKNVTFIKNSTHLSGSNIILKLPNLTSLF